MTKLLMATCLLLALAPAAWAAPALHGSLGVTAMPLGFPMVGLSAEGRLDEAHLAIAAEGVTALQGSTKVWAAWTRWTPLEANGHALGVMAGYNQSTMAYPGPWDPGTPLLEPPAALVGLVYQWSTPSFLVRVSPYAGWNLQNGGFGLEPTYRSLFGGPPLLETAWRVTSSFDVGLRLTATFLRVGYVW